MEKLCKFWQLPAHDKRLLLTALLLLYATKIGLACLSFKIILHLLEALKQRPYEVRKHSRAYSEKIVWAIDVVSHYSPWPMTCLVRALTAKILLSRYDCATQLHIGIAKEENGRLLAHAWLESEGKILIGDLQDLGRYKSFNSTY